MKKDEIIYGFKPVMEAIASGREIDRILIQSGIRFDKTRELKTMAIDHMIPVQFVPPGKLDRLCRDNHQGVVALVTVVSYSNMENVIMNVFDRGETPLVLLLDNITDVRNFGGIARSAEASGTHAIIIPETGSVRINADSVKTSAGALNIIPVCRVAATGQAVDYLRNSGLQILSACEKGDRAYYEADFTVPTAIVMGSEESGISPSIVRQSDHTIRIPMTGKIGSLNVSVAAGIILFEALRQKSIPKP